MMTDITPSMFLPKPKSGATRIDADGKEVEVEVREDEEQKVKLQEIFDLLVAAGYFKARFKGLSAFDKVVGGMTWCIENCNFDVDVDLLFQENLTIGQRIALTEKIVSVLPKMECPHRIEPHQIQGLDCIHIFPVIQWLVKRSLETRQEMGEQIRAFSVSQFERNFTFPGSNIEVEMAQAVWNNVRQVEETYRPQRKFRRKDAPPEDEESRVQSTLLEYGQRPLIVATSTTDKEVKSSDDSEDVCDLEEQEAQKLEQRKIASLMQSMAIAEDIESSRVAVSVVGSIVSLQAGEIAMAAGQYAELKEGLQTSPGGEGSVARRIAGLTRKKEALAEEVAQLEKQKQKLCSQVEESSAKLDQATKGLYQLHQGVTEIQAAETVENQGTIHQLQTLVVLNDSLKSQEVQFREQCHSELNNLQSLIAEAEQKPLASSCEEEGELARQVSEEKAKLQRARLSLAKRNRAIAGLQRQLDEVPGRSELAQYQRRFLELYNQVGGKHKETKQYFTLYNTLHDTHLYLSKELSLLNSIQDNYPAAMANSSSKEQFLKQFEAIVEGIKSNKSKVEAKRNEERNRRDRLSQNLLALVELQRRYVSAVRQLTIECRRNESLLAELRTATAQEKL